MLPRTALPVPLNPSPVISCNIGFYLRVFILIIVDRPSAVGFQMCFFNVFTRDVLNIDHYGLWFEKVDFHTKKPFIAFWMASEIYQTIQMSI